jgi:protein TonB
MKPRRRKWSRIAFGVAGLLLGGGALGAIIFALLSAGEGPKQAPVHNITLLRPPPPPPPPKVEEKQPEPEVKKEEVKIPEEQAPEQPDQAQDQAPPGEQLGVDAEGGAGGDGFGLAARKGGRDITSFGGGSPYAGFAGTVQQHIQDELAKRDKLRKEAYRVVVNLWIAPDGRLTRYELASSTGNPKTDEQLRLALDELAPFRSPPPQEMPQPVKLRITSRSAG